MKINKYSIALDVDGVLLDFEKGFRNAIKIVTGKDLINTSNNYPLKQRYSNLSDNEHIAVWQYLDKEGLANFPIYEGVDIAFNRLKETGYEIHLVTGIWESSKEMRLENLKKYNMIPHTIDCVGTGISDKDIALRKHNPFYFVDDRIQHLESAPFIPNRIWIDLKDDQMGFEPTTEYKTYSTFVEFFKDNESELLLGNNKPHINELLSIA